MELIQAIILAVIQGITEWLPISSSGHLAIFQHYFGLNENLTYDVLLHFASLIVIVIVFYKDIIELLHDKKKIGFVIVGTIPIVIVGFLIKDSIQAIFDNVLLVGCFLILTSIILFYSVERKKTRKMNLKNSIIVGLFQAMAILPGVSRSGSTIGGSLILGIKKEEAIRFSFLLAIPAILGATILNIDDLAHGIDMNMIVGFIVAIVISYYVLKLMINLVLKNRLRWFAYYCLIVGIVIVVLQLL